MAEPDSPQDRVLYEKISLHAPKGLVLDIPVGQSFDVIGGGSVPGAGTSLFNTSVIGSLPVVPGFATTLTSATLLNGRALIGFLEVNSTFKTDEIAFEVITTVGSVGAVARMGIWKATPSGVNVREAVITTTAIEVESLGIKVFPMAPVVFQPGIYGYTVVCQGAPTTRPTLRAVSVVSGAAISSSFAFAGGIIVDGLTGILTSFDPQATVAGSTATVPAIRFRVAA